MAIFSNHLAKQVLVAVRLGPVGAAGHDGAEPADRSAASQAVHGHGGRAGDDGFWNSASGQSTSEMLQLLLRYKSLH